MISTGIRRLTTDTGVLKVENNIKVKIFSMKQGHLPINIESIYFVI